MQTEIEPLVPWVWMDSFNHHPAYPNVWVPYNGQRYKEYYDIRLKDGTVHRKCRPNAIYWGNDQISSIRDDEVAEICLLHAKEHPSEYMASITTQQDIVEHCVYLFGEEDFPDVIPAGDGVAFIPKQFRRFASMVQDADGEWVFDLPEGALTLEEALALQLPPGHNLDEVDTEPAG